MRRLLAVVAVAGLSLFVAWAADPAPSAQAGPSEVTPIAGSEASDPLVAAVKPAIAIGQSEPDASFVQPSGLEWCGEHPCLQVCTDPYTGVCEPGYTCSRQRQSYQSCLLAGGGTFTCPGTKHVSKLTCPCYCPGSDFTVACENGSSQDTQVTLSCVP